MSISCGKIVYLQRIRCKNRIHKKGIATSRLKNSGQNCRRTQATDAPSIVSCKPQVYPVAWNNRRGISFFVQSYGVNSLAGSRLGRNILAGTFRRWTLANKSHVFLVLCPIIKRPLR